MVAMRAIIHQYFCFYYKNVVLFKAEKELICIKNNKGKYFSQYRLDFGIIQTIHFNLFLTYPLKEQVKAV